MKACLQRKLSIVALIATASAALLVPCSACASEVTRAEYVMTADPICKRAVQANLGLFRGIKPARLKAIANRFLRAAKSFRKSVRELAAVPRPSADEPTLSRWLDALRTETDLLADLGSSLKAEEKARAQHYAKRLHKNANYADNLVLSFGFAYCTLDPGRFI